MQKAVPPEPGRLLPRARLRPGLRLRAPGQRGGAPAVRPAELLRALGLVLRRVAVHRATPRRSTCCAGRRTGRASTGSRTAGRTSRPCGPWRAGSSSGRRSGATGSRPGESSDVIAEFKVDSARLPHGAQLWRMDADGNEKLIALLRRRRAALAHRSVSSDARRLRGPLARAGVRGQPRRRRRAALPARARRRLRGGPARPVRARAAGRRVRRPGVRAHHLHLAGRSRSSCSPSTTPGCGWSTPGGRAPVARQLGLEEFDFGVYQGWAPAHEVTDLREHRV